jgi:uncharacterized protein (DUF58 family)
VRYRPGPRLPAALGAVAAFALLAPLWPPLALVSAGAFAAVVAWAVIEGVLLARVELRVEREPHLALSLGEVEVMPLFVSHAAPFDLRVLARCRLPDVLGAGAAAASGVAPLGQRLQLQVEVRGVQRGREPLPQPVLAFTRFGLCERIAGAGAPAEVSVLPNLRAVRRLHEQLNDFFLRGAGTRMAPRIGQGREFDRLREYVAGDDFRHLAWKASARARKLIVRDFRVERSQDVLLCVDRGHRMAGRVGELTRADHAVNAAVLTAYLCNRAEDRTGMLSFADDVDRGVVQGRGGAHLAALTRFGTGVAPEYVHTDYRALAAHLRRRLKQRTLLMLLTALPERGDHEPLIQSLHALMPRHLMCIIVLRDPALEALAGALPATPAELCRALVAGDLVSGRQKTVQELRRAGAIVAEAAPEDAGVAAVNAYLDVKRRQLL